MEYAENGTLTKFINDHEDKEYNWDFNTNLIKQITQGLAYIHHEGIIHRDLKSMNILLANNYQVKIADFGLSKVKDISSLQSDGVKGSLRWMAPELLRGKKHPKYSEQSDIYALGMIMWEIAARCTIPFKDTENSLVYLRIIDGKREAIPDDTPQNIQNIIQGCWKDNPQQRISLANILKTIENNGANSQLQNIQVINDEYFSQNIELDIMQENSDQCLVNRSKRRQLSQDSQAKTSQGEPKQTKIIHSEPMEIKEVNNQSANIQNFE